MEAGVEADASWHGDGGRAKAAGQREAPSPRTELSTQELLEHLEHPSSDMQELSTLQQLIKRQLPAAGERFVSDAQCLPCRELITGLLRLANSLHERGRVTHNAIDESLAEVLAARLAGLKKSVSEWLYDQGLLASLLHAYVLISHRNSTAVGQLAQSPKMFAALLRAMTLGSVTLQKWACLLLSQLAISSPEAAVEIGEMPGLSESLAQIIAGDPAGAIISGFACPSRRATRGRLEELDDANKREQHSLSTNAVLLINNIAGTGGEAGESSEYLKCGLSALYRQDKSCVPEHSPTVCYCVMLYSKFTKSPNTAEPPESRNPTPNPYT